jgi:hypothetical protein
MIGRLFPPYDMAEMPASMQRLPTTSKGIPIPWFVDRRAPLKDGEADFRIMDGGHLKTAIREKRCWVCGGRIVHGHGVFVAGPMCGINRTSAEPPCHHDCAVWSIRACPFLSQPKRIRDERDMPEGHFVTGVGITRNPGVSMLWHTKGYKTYRPDALRVGVLFELGEPLVVEWWREGRLATRAEVMESIGTGLPILLNEAAKEGAVACMELGRMVERFMHVVPAE